jgi:hypothetical protein
MPARGGLPRIPIHDLGNVAELVHLERARALDLLAEARRAYSGAGLRLGDRLSRRWLERRANPYLPDIAAIAQAMGRPGGYALNLSYEWACTCGVRPGFLARTLDWRLNGLGRNAVIATFQGQAGSWTSVTWPGFAGVVTGLAKGRFAAAINQAPLPRARLTYASDWLQARVALWKSAALPPAHLLRLAFETCASYGEAKALLRDRPVALPVFFSLAGPRQGEACVIERTAGGAFLHDGPCAVANHWLTPGHTGAPRGHDSAGRLALMERGLHNMPWSFDWLRPPILNRDTRLAVLADAVSGRLAVQGWEGERPATELLDISC